MIIKCPTGYHDELFAFANHLHPKGSSKRTQAYGAACGELAVGTWLGLRDVTLQNLRVDIPPTPETYRYDLLVSGKMVDVKVVTRSLFLPACNIDPEVLYCWLRPVEGDWPKISVARLHPPTFEVLGAMYGRHMARPLYPIPTYPDARIARQSVSDWMTPDQFLEEIGR